MKNFGYGVIILAIVLIAIISSKYDIRISNRESVPQYAHKWEAD